MPHRWLRSGMVNRCYLQCAGTRLLQAQAIGLHELSYRNDTHSQILWEWAVPCLWGRRQIGGRVQIGPKCPSSKLYIRYDCSSNAEEEC